MTDAPLEGSVQRLYDSLRDISGRLLGPHRSLGTKDATEFVHEAWLRLARHGEVEALPQRDFLKLAATVLRRLIIDDHRRARTLAQGGGWRRISLRDPQITESPGSLDLLALDEALDRLAQRDSRQARIVELRYFGGLRDAEIADVLGIGPRTVTRDWTMARAWLRREMHSED